ncbi:MAG: PadR family transcriptional regulator [Natronosporangium sp.]
MKAEALKGHLDALLLATVDGGAEYGYAIREVLRTESGGEFDLPTGTIYPALYRLERAGLIVGQWTKVGVRRRRRCYRLTPAGRRALVARRASWNKFSTAVSSVLLPERTWSATT